VKLGRYALLVVLLAIAGLLVTLGRNGRSGVLHARSGRALRLVVLTHGAAEVVRALGAMEQVVGLSDDAAQALCFPELSRIPVVGRWNAPDYEKISMLKPDRLIAFRSAPGPELERTLGRLGVGVTRIDLFRVSTMTDEIRALGRLLERDAEAARLVSFWTRRIEHVQARLARARVTARPRILVEGYAPYRSAGPGSGVHEMVDLAGGQNLAATLRTPYPELDPEWVLKMAPEVIVKTVAVRADCARGTDAALQRVRAELVARPGWSSLPAVRTGRVHVLTADIGPGPRAVVGALHLARWLYPELLGDLAPGAVCRDYLQRFQGRHRGAIASLRSAE